MVANVLPDLRGLPLACRDKSASVVTDRGSVRKRHPGGGFRALRSHGVRLRVLRQQSVPVHDRETDFAGDLLVLRMR